LKVRFPQPKKFFFNFKKMVTQKEYFFKMAETLILPKKIVSGGQTGADRGALDFAIDCHIECGGFCPRGRVSEDGKIPEKYVLTELLTADYPARTKKNIEIADATAIFSLLPLTLGSDLTRRMAINMGKPYIVLSGFPLIENDITMLCVFLRTYRPQTLNIAGTRESKLCGIHDHVYNVLRSLYTSLLDRKSCL
jgi:hypothetical protein